MSVEITTELQAQAESLLSNGPTGPQPNQPWNFRSWLSRAFKFGPPLECTWTDTATGNQYDFTSLRKKTDDYEGQDRIYRYKFNICGPTNAHGMCATNRGSLCQFSAMTGNYVANLGSWDGNPRPTWGLIDPANPGKGVQLTFRNGDICWINHVQVTRTANVQLICSDTQDDRFSIQEQLGTCTFNVRMRTPLACVGGAASSSSFGSFGLLVILAIVVYLGVGCYWNVEHHGKQWGTVDAIPNLEFWKSVPGYTKEGALFTYAKINQLLGREDASAQGYEKVSTTEEPTKETKDAKKDNFDDL